MRRAYAAVGAVDKAQKKMWALLSFTFVQLPDQQFEAAQQEAGYRLEGEVMHFFLYKHGAISTPLDFKRRHVEIETRGHLYVSQSALLVKQDDTPWRLCDESI